MDLKRKSIIKLQFHNWDSIDPRDLMERYEIVKLLKETPMNELIEVFKNMRTESVRAAIDLMMHVRKM